MYGSQKSSFRSRFLLVFIDSRVYRLSKTSSFVFVLLYSWEPLNASITRIGPAEQICMGFIESWSPARVKQAVLYLFLYIHWISERHRSKKSVLRSRFVLVFIDYWSPGGCQNDAARIGNVRGCCCNRPGGCQNDAARIGIVRGWCCNRPGGGQTDAARIGNVRGWCCNRPGGSQNDAARIFGCFLIIFR